MKTLLFKVDDPFNLNRFVLAQHDDYERALAEIKNGRKRSHWMWYIFPQLDGLGSSSMAQRYAIKSADEARAYLAHPVLGSRLLACAEAAVANAGNDATEIFGSPDDLKLRSSATLFACVVRRGFGVSPAALEVLSGRPRYDDDPITRNTEGAVNQPRKRRAESEPLQAALARFHDQRANKYVTAAGKRFAQAISLCCAPSSTVRAFPRSRRF